MKGPLTRLSPSVCPRRLAEAGSDAERRLLASAGQDGAPSAAAAHMASRLGAVLVDSPEVAAPASRAAPNGSPRLRLERFGPKPLVGLVLLGGVAGLWLWGQRPSSEAASSALAPGAASALPRTVAAGAGSLPSSELQPQSEAPSATPFTSPVIGPAMPASGAQPAPTLTPLRAQRPSATARGARRAPQQGALAEEVRTLDAIRSALNAGDAPGAARELERYGQRFPEGELRLESELLAVDLALAEGQHERARARAQELLARPGSARYAEHLRRALDGSNPSDVHIGERR